MLDTLKQTLEFLHEQISKFLELLKKLLRTMILLYRIYKAIDYFKNLLF